MVSPANDDAGKLQLGICGDDFEGLISALKMINHLRESEEVVDDLLTSYIKEKKGKLDLDYESLKAGFAYCIQVTGTNIVQAAKVADKGRKRDRAND